MACSPAEPSPGKENGDCGPHSKLILEKARRFLETKELPAGEQYLFAVPIRQGSQIAGALVVLLEPEAPFDNTMQSMCDTVAAHLGLAAERDRLYRYVVDSEVRYRTVTEHAMVGVVLAKKDRFIYVNETFAQMLGYAPSEIVEHMKPKSLADPDDWDLADDILESFDRGTLSKRRFVIRARHKDGSRRYLEVLAQTVKYNDHKALLATVLDVTSTYQRDRERARLAQAIQQAAEGIMICDRNWKIQYVNPAFEKITGFRREELLGRHAKILQGLMEKHDRSFFENMEHTLRKGSIWKGTIFSRRKDGSEYETDCVITPLFDEDGRVESFIAVERDVTRERLLEREARINQKMQALGTLASGIAHDFNNILTIISGYAEITRMTLSDLGNGIQEPLERIMEAVQRARDLTQQILTFSRQREHELQTMNARHIVKEAVKMLRAVLPSTVKIRENYQLYRPDDDRILGDPSQIHQVMINLGSNAAHAMQETGGEFFVEMKPVTVDSETAQRVMNLKTGRYLQLTVSDTGCGMTPEVLDRIFEPYFTTKEVGEGTGLGLATVHGIVEGHGGAIDVESEPGTGTTFRIYLPLTDTERQETAAKGEVPKIPRGHGRILVIDDERSLVDIATRILTRLGYDVVTHTDPLEALVSFRRNPGGFDVVFTDQTMPEMNGLKLARAIRDIRPDIPIILTTGHSELVTSQTLEEAGVDFLVTKPYEVRELTKTIQEALWKGEEIG